MESARSKQKGHQIGNFGLKNQIGQDDLSKINITTTPRSELEKMTTQDEASRLTQMNSFNACDKIYLPISFVHFKTDGPLASPNGGLVAVMSDDR